MSDLIVDPNLTPEALQLQAQKQAMQEQAQFMARRMQLLAQKLDVDLQLEMMGMEPLIADVLTSALAACAVRNGLRQSRIISDFQEKMVRAARFAKAQEGDAAANGVIPDGVPPADKDALRKLGVRFQDDPPDLPPAMLTIISDPSENKPEAPSDVAPNAAPAS
jgi:hypothetical protein